MAVKKISTDEAKKYFDKARAFAMAATNDPNDPASDNLLKALHAYFTSIAAAEVEIVSALNDLLERVDHIQTKVDMPRR